MQKKLVIGLTGGIASGKTSVANYLATRGAYLVDTDIIAREVVAPNSPITQKITSLLGQEYLLADGNLNRAKIKQLIFSNAIIKKQYEDIILPAIRNETLKQLNNPPLDSCYTLLIVPLLFEKGLDCYCDYTICVDIDINTQIQRAIERKPSDKDVIIKIIQAQMPREQRNEKADFIMDNNRSKEDLIMQLEQLHQTLINI